MTDLSTESSDTQAERPAWPKTIGIISIILGGLYMCCGACGLVQLVRGPQQMPEGVSPPPQPPPMSAIMQVVGLLLAIVLLAAGILLVNRREAGRWLHLIYSIVAIPTGLVGLVVGFGITGAMRQWINDNPKMEKMGGFIMLMTYFFLAVGALPMLYNVFLLVWFGVLKRKADLGARDPLI
jgi:cytochrome bd-type quinol oxidase subunit 1